MRIMIIKFDILCNSIEHSTSYISGAQSVIRMKVIVLRVIIVVLVWWITAAEVHLSIRKHPSAETVLSICFIYLFVH